MGGCGGAAGGRAAIGAELVANDQVAVRELPPPLQQMLLSLSVGQATPPFGSRRADQRAGAVRPRRSAAGERAERRARSTTRSSEERVNRRAQRYLRDLRRDAVIDYR